MAKVSGCLCWPKMSQSKRKDPKESPSQFSAQNSTFDTTTGDRGNRTIPKKHDDFIEMLFRPGRHRSRTLTTSLFSAPKRRSDAAGSDGDWFPRRTSSLLSAERYSTEQDLRLFETVPVTPGAAFQRELFSSTLPPLRWSNHVESAAAAADAAGEARRGRSSDVWPEYIWRLNQKRQQRCPCVGCENATPANACAGAYRHPVRHTDAVGAYFDDDDGSPRGRGIEEGGLDRRGTRGYDRPRSRGSGVGVETEPYDVPASSGFGGDDWMFCGRGSLKDRAGKRRTDSAEFQARPRSASLEQRAFRPAAAAKGRTAVGCGEDGPDFPVCSWRRCGHQTQQQQHYDRPTGLYPLRPNPPPNPPHLGHRRGGCQRTMRRSSFGLRCFACELKLETMSEEWDRIDGYCLPGGTGRRSHRAYDGGDSGYMQSDREIEAQSGTGRATSQALHPEMNCVIPSGMFVERKRAVCCHDDGDGGGNDAEYDDYLAPLSSANFKRFQIERDRPERYLAMNSGASTKDRKETSGSEETERQKQQMTKIPQSDDDDDDDGDDDGDDGDDVEGQREQETRDEFISEGKFLASADKGDSDPKEPDESSAISGKSVHDPVEGEPEGKEMGGDSVGKVSILVDQEGEAEGNGLKSTATEAANSLPSGDIKEPAAVPVTLKEAAAAATPPASTRALDLLYTSPPPQCSFMVGHSYANVADSGNTVGDEKPVPFKNYDLEEKLQSKGRNAPKNVESIEEAADEIYFASKSKTGDYLARWEDLARLGGAKHPGSQYVVLHRKASSGNNYCHTYLPTLRENLKNSCKTK